MQGSDTLSGNAYSNWYSYAAPGSNFSPAHPDAPHITVYDDIDDLRDVLSNESGGDDDCDCDCDCEWGSNYDDSIWSKGGSVSVVNNVVSDVSSWGSLSVPKRNWKTFFRSNADTKKTSSGITTAVSNFADKSNNISQTGVTGALAFGVRIEGSVLFVKDSYGKWDILLTGVFGGGTPAAG